MRPGILSSSALSLLVAAGVSVIAQSGLAAQSFPPDQNYYVYVGAESADLMHRVKLGPDGVKVDQTTPVGEISVETEGPHGFNVSPDGKYIYMTTGHGVPDGKLWKFEAGSDSLVAAPILLGFFPATVDLTPDGLFAFVTNFNLHGEKIPSTISVVYTPDMIEVAQVETCVMPHGGRVSPDGMYYYTNCMMDDVLVEIDTRTFEVSRVFSVELGAEGPLDATDHPGIMAELGRVPGGYMNTCSPTWAQPTPDGKSVYVACNKGDQILEIDRESWTLVRKFPSGRGAYNLAVSPDERTIVATLKQGGMVEFFDTETGESKGVVESTTTVTHGVVVTPDSRYAFVSVEGVGAEPGKVDVYDLRTLEMVGSVEVGQQAGGIVFWKMEPVE